MSSRRELVDDFLALVGAQNDTNARTRAERNVWRAIDRIWQKHPWTQFEDSVPYVFTTVSGQRSYPMPAYFGRVHGERQLIQNITNRGPMSPLTQEELIAYDPLALTDNESPGTPSRYIISGVVGVQVQPAAAGEAIEVLSDSAADVAVRALVEGIRANGEYDRTQVTLTGTSAVDLGSWKYIQRFGKSLVAGLTPATKLTQSEGTVTLRTTGPPNVTLQTLLPDEFSREHTVMTLYPKPNVAHQIAVPVMRRPLRQRFDADPIPLDWDDAIIERMLIAWRIAGGQIRTDDGVPTPAFVDLVCLDNIRRPNSPRVPFSGG